jgi:hypothetical protein
MGNVCLYEYNSYLFVQATKRESDLSEQLLIPCAGFRTWAMSVCTTALLLCRLLCVNHFCRYYLSLTVQTTECEQCLPVQLLFLCAGYRVWAMSINTTYHSLRRKLNVSYNCLYNCSFSVQATRCEPCLSVLLITPCAGYWVWTMSVDTTSHSLCRLLNVSYVCL